MDIRLQTLSLLCLALLLTGCTTQTVIDPPSPELPAQFTGVSNTLAPQAHQQWWLDLNDAQLNRLIDLALVNNYDLKASVSKVRQAEALATKARSTRMPTLDATADAGRTFQSGSDASNYQFGLRASYEIDLWSRLRAAETSGWLDFLASRETLETAALSITADVADRWYALLTQIALEQLYSQQLQTLEQQFIIIEFRFRHGQIPSEDMLQQQQQIQNLNSKLDSAQYQQQIIQQQLALLLGRSQWSVIDRSTTLPKLSQLPATGLPAELAARRPDLKHAWLQLQSQQQHVIIAEADRLPQIRFSASLLSPTQHFSELMNDWVGNLAASIAAPLLDGSLRKAEVARQQALLDESVNNYSQKVLSAFGEIESAITRETLQQQQLDSIELQLSLAKQSEHIKWTRYSHGASGFLDVLNAQKSRLDLEQQRVQVHGQLLSERIALHRAIAGDIAYSERLFSELNDQTGSEL